jgi:tripartite-type tricarboxylate transporter receptor subunit TctC
MKTLLRCVIFVAAALAGTGIHAQAYPTRPLHWIVAFSAGGPNDVLTRAIAVQLAANLGQPVIVENRAASAGIAGTEAVAKAAPDGYTLLTTTSGMFLFQKHLYRKLPYDPDRDFAPVSQIASTMVGMFVHHSLPVKSVKELVAYAKANPES